MKSYCELNRQMDEFQIELDALAFEVLMFESIVLEELRLIETNELKIRFKELTKNLSKMECGLRNFRASLSEIVED